MPLFLLALQTAAAIATPAAGYDDFDLAKLPAKTGCDTTDTTSIVVCGRKKAMDFVFGHPLGYAEKRIRTGVALPDGGSVTAHAVQRELPGARAPAAMVTLRLPF